MVTMADDLLDLLRELEHDGDPRIDWTHVLMPNMAFVCDGGPLGLLDGGPPGHWTIGTSVRDWPRVTCLECRKPGLREVLRRAHMMQNQPDHECPKLDDIFPAHRCYHWQSIPPETAG